MLAHLKTFCSFKALYQNSLRQDSWPWRTSLCALLPVGLLLPLSSGERQAFIHFSYWKIRRVHCFFDNLDILHLLNTKAILFYIPRWLWKNWEAGKVSVIISHQILETNLSHVLFHFFRLLPWRWISTWGSSRRGRSGWRRSWSLITFTAILGPMNMFAFVVL